MKKCILTITLIILLLCSSACDREHVDTLTYAVFPYIPDIEYYQELIEARWAELEPDIKLVRANWDCYYDGVPEGIDVVMYDAVMRDTLISDGWIQPIDTDAVQDGKPQYLMLARKSPYKHLAEQFAMYSELEKLANNEKNHVILTP